ncbi:hypothetical protein [Clostridium tetani]|uniref:hypothetical protein n=1 Tax=Clostridium tetani TaxID=1513 RepID=UPI001FB0FF1D|nr:hypothetical protein [Clostridium tetani]
MGLQFVVYLIIADNQETIAYKMHEKGLIYNLGWFTILTKDKILDNIKKYVN